METKNALIIDDNEIDRFVCQKLLEMNGFTHIYCSRSCKDALIHLQETNLAYQLIITDIFLPIMNGFEFIDKFNELGLHKKHGKICLLSASLNPLDKEKAKQKDIRFIDKPLTIDSL